MAQDQINNQINPAPSAPPSDDGSAENNAVAVGELSTFDNSDPTVSEGANVLKERAKAKSFENESYPNLRAEGGINLIPTMTEQQLDFEQKKTSFNLFSAFAILFLVLLTIGILGYNVLTKISLNNDKKELNALEQELLSNSDVIKANKEILQRFDLYKEIQETTFSPKEVLLYWEDLLQGYGDVKSIELNNGLRFSVTGSTGSLTEISFLWHILTVDEKIQNMNLESMSKSKDIARFNFEGELDFDYFLAKENALISGEQNN
ncbi:hypothetical protein H6763_01625 [Candidatus Nomurabacteria bacterium]|uniref:PilN domain-containing protein n=1 Tax=Candidatus Dojkabacteria bacterium TaxID=2099670 RepID=A0A955I2R2_9BACT|nr:hypothetical protein [Candidatus Dojkabacteria bacterium]MCB9789870.1 hypothetical protein [Candidatus Nomurabacteria bacterium]MCB9803506.1 hypothetical protein [Candidatus Nomurabacteria bacterium]